MLLLRTTIPHTHTYAPSDIMSALEKEYPNNKPLYPPSTSPQAARVSGLLKLEVGKLLSQRVSE